MKIRFVSANKCYTTIWNDYIDETWQEVYDLGTWNEVRGKPVKMSIGRVCETGKVKVNSVGECSTFKIKYRGVKCD